jgi:transposase
MSYIGIDVSKDTLDIAFYGKPEVEQVLNNGSSIQQVVEHLLTTSPTCIVLEATGGYEQPFFLALKDAGLPVVRVNPRQVRDFAKACGILAKTDRLDAQVLARYAATLQPEPSPYERPESLRELLRYRQQLIEQRTRLQIQKKQYSDAFIVDSIESQLALLQTALVQLEEEVDRRVKASPPLKASREVLESVKGVGKVTSAVLLGGLPELGCLNRKEIASLAGVAPKNRDSGMYRGKRSCWGGRASIRQALYMAVMSARRHNADIRDFYDRLRLAGKPYKVAMTACMRKLLVILNARLRDHLSTST